MEDRGRRRRSGDGPRRRERRGEGGRRGAEQYAASPAPPTRAPRKPRAVPGPAQQNTRQSHQLYPPRKPRRRQVDAVLAEASGFTPSLGISPGVLHTANNTKYTSLHHCCSRCTPSSKEKFCGKLEGVSGLENVLQVDTRPFRRFPYRVAPYFSFVMKQQMPYSMADHRRDTFTSSRVRSAIEQCARSSVSDEPTADPAALRQAVREQEKRAHGIIQSMSAAVCAPLVKLVGWVFFWVFKKLFGRIEVQKRHKVMLLEAQKRGVPMVFLPNHKSHMDYLIMTFVLFSMGIRIPRIAAGDNLRLPIVSWFVTRLGGFFIKRKLDSSTGKDVLYRKCLHEYMERVLLAGENVEFFIEGSRSRSGKPGYPKAGLLSVVVDTVKNGLVDDVLLVPVSISYNRILERNFVKEELMGGVKKPETVMEAVRGGWSMLTQNVGTVRVDFAQPFSLQEFLSKAVVSTNSLLELSCANHRRSMSSLTEHSHRKLVTALSYHIVYDITSSASLMPTAMVAFLLLNKHRQGVKMADLVTSYTELEKMAQAHGRAVSFSGEASEAVHYALHHIRHLVTVDHVPCQQSGNEVIASGDQKLRPLLELPHVFDLCHHSNQIAPLFALEAIVACSVLSVAREGKKSKKEISRDKVTTVATFLSQLMAREFILTPPCAELSLSLTEVIDDFISYEVLKNVSSGFQGNRRGRHLDFEEDDWEEYVPDMKLQVSSQPEAQRRLNFLSSMMEPLVDSYWLASTSLLALPAAASQELNEAELLAQLQQTAEVKAGKGLLSRVESCSMDTLRNSLKMLHDLDVLVPARNGTLKVANSNRLVDIVENLTRLRF